MSTERTKQIEQAASEWLARRDSGNWTEPDQVHFDAWLGESTLNRVAYLRLRRAWDDARRLKALGAGIQSDRPPPPEQWNLTPFFESAPSAAPASSVAAPFKTLGAGSIARQRRKFVAIAASALLAMASALVWHFWPAGIRYSTPVGGVASVPMIDGSKVTLNTDSRIRVAITDTERRIELMHGEAFFEVAKDSTRPFIVSAGGQRVIAVGTKFSVRSDADDFEVVVTEGKVRIEGTSSLRAWEAGEHFAADGSNVQTPASGSSALELAAGSIVRASEASVRIETKALAEAEEELSWRNGVLVFRNQTLAAAIAEFNRYNTRKIVMDDPHIGSLRIEGNFRATNVDAFARLLEQGYAVDVQQRDDQIVLARRR